MTQNMTYLLTNITYQPEVNVILQQKIFFAIPKMLTSNQLKSIIPSKNITKHHLCTG